MEVSKYNSKLRALALFVMLNLFGFTSMAQLSSAFVTPSNMFTIAEDVLHSYNSYVNIADNEIRNFIFSSQISGIYDADIVPPYVFLTHMDEQSATLGWWGGHNDMDLRIRYLNLQTGERNEIFPDPGTYSITLPNNSQDYYVYLLTYVRKDQSGTVTKSADYIIIEENPAIRETPALACDCTEPFTILSRTSFEDIEQNMNGILVNDLSLVEDRMYKVEFRANDQTGMYHIVKRGGKAPFHYDVSISEGCIENVKLPDNEFQFYGLLSEQPNSSVLGFSLGYQTGLRMNWLDQSVNGTIKVTDCGLTPTLGELRSTPKPTLSSLHHFPNPTSGYSTLQYELVQDGPISLWITDARGQIVSTLEEEIQKISGSYSVELDLNKLPNGLYTAHLQIAGQRQALRLLKVN